MITLILTLELSIKHKIYLIFFISISFNRNEFRFFLLFIDLGCFLLFKKPFDLVFCDSLTLQILIRCIDSLESCFWVIIVFFDDFFVAFAHIIYYIIETYKNKLLFKLCSGHMLKYQHHFVELTFYHQSL